jgi:molybdenum cofactor cytidylyltransferase
MTAVAAVVLAAGGSRRMGQPKQLLLVDGQPMVTRVVQAVLAAGLSDVVVVLGAAADEVQPELAGLPVRLTVNKAWREGMASSLRAGLALVSPTAEAALFVPADLPRLTAQTITAVVDCFAGTGKPIVIPTWQGCRGNPVLFARRLFPELLAVQGDQGGRALFASHQQDIALVEVGDEGILLDVDTPEQYKSALSDKHRS